MKKMMLGAAVALSMLGLAGCGDAMQGASAQGAFEQTLKDGRVVQCVQVTGHSGDVSVDCDFENSEEPTP